MTDPLYLTPNVEALCSAFLADQPEVADEVAERVYTTIPKQATYPLVRVTVLDSTPTGEPLWLEAHTVQVEAFGGSKAEAFRIAVKCRAAISQRLTGDHPGAGVVTGVRSAGLLDLPDDSHTPAKPRWLFTSTVYAHPGATLPS